MAVRFRKFGMFFEAERKGCTKPRLSIPKKSATSQLLTWEEIPAWYQLVEMRHSLASADNNQRQ